MVVLYAPIEWTVLDYADIFKGEPVLPSIEMVTSNELMLKEYEHVESYIYFDGYDTTPSPFRKDSSCDSYRIETETYDNPSFYDDEVEWRHWDDPDTNDINFYDHRTSSLPRQRSSNYHPRKEQSRRNSRPRTNDRRYLNQTNDFATTSKTPNHNESRYSHNFHHSYTDPLKKKSKRLYSNKSFHKCKSKKLHQFDYDKPQEMETRSANPSARIWRGSLMRKSIYKRREHLHRAGHTSFNQNNNTSDEFFLYPDQYSSPPSRRCESTEQTQEGAEDCSSPAYRSTPLRRTRSKTDHGESTFRKRLVNFF